MIHSATTAIGGVYTALTRDEDDKVSLPVGTQSAGATREDLPLTTQQQEQALH